MKSLPLTGLVPNSSYSVSVRGKDANGNYTPWSKFTTFTTIQDITAPSKPAAPTVWKSDAAGDNINTLTVLVRHDGNKNAGGALESDTVLLKVYAKNPSTLTTTLLGDIPFARASGAISQKVFTCSISSFTSDPDFYVVAVDKSGNESPASNSSKASAQNFFKSAYISDLSADKITTGTLQASTQVSVGTTTPIVLRSNSSAPYGEIFIGTGTYNNSNTPFYVGSNNKFSLGSSLTWDGSSLSVTGAITATSGTFTGTVNATGGDFTSYITAGGTSIGKNWAIGATTYSGIKINDNNYFGITGTSPRFQISNGLSGDSERGINWNGSVLTIKGELVATGGSFISYLTAGIKMYLGKGISITGQTGSWDGLLLDAGSGYNFWATNGTDVKFQVGSETKYVKWTGSSLDIQGNINASTITGGLFRTSASGTRIEISGVNDISIAGTAASLDIIDSSKSYQGALLYVSDAEVGDSVELYPPGNDVSRTRLTLGNTGLKITQKSNTSVTIKNSTPSGDGSSSRSVRNIYITSNTGNPVGFTGGDVWLVYV